MTTSGWSIGPRTPPSITSRFKEDPAFAEGIWSRNRRFSR